MHKLIMVLVAIYCPTACPVCIELSHTVFDWKASVFARVHLCIQASDDDKERAGKALQIFETLNNSI